MHISPLHDWQMTPQEAIALQKQLAAQVVYDRPLPLDRIRLIAGVDVSVKPNAHGVDFSHAAIVVMRYPSLEIIETRTATLQTPFPYISGLLSFREGAVIIQAARQLEHVPDVFLFDGMGRAHPRRLGIAAHLGLWLNAPTIGCGKTHLIGAFQPLAPERGAFQPLVHRGETIGVVLRTRDKVSPVYISSGHLIDLDSAREITLAVTPTYRLPQPIRAAHNAAGIFD
jgi:deoxyribonuclease V